MGGGGGCFKFQEILDFKTLHSWGRRLGDGACYVPTGCFFATGTGSVPRGGDKVRTFLLTSGGVMSMADDEIRYVMSI